MAKHRLWFIKVGDIIRGPFPATQIRHNVLLGRLQPDMLVSEDQQNWRALRELPALYDSEQIVDIVRERRLLDERHQDRRQSGEAGTESRRANPDRRQPEDPEVMQARQKRAEVWHSLAGPPPHRSRIPAIALGFALLLAVLGYLLPHAPTVERTSVDCDAVPAPAGVWDGCELAAAELAGADLQRASFAYAKLIDADFSHATLIGARLAGADLRRARLQSASLQEADLSHADLRDADLSGAELRDTVLSGAIWPDGTRCAKPSVGACLRIEGEGAE
ncbi:MAG: pentapeptide repeat-containing protein [Gammaproteobacteria bacterium]|nr:pentapeptide repeat-containing protein [Gammaproteobacteria bacterium]